MAKKKLSKKKRRRRLIRRLVLLTLLLAFVTTLAIFSPKIVKDSVIGYRDMGEEGEVFDFDYQPVRLRFTVLFCYLGSF